MRGAFNYILDQADHLQELLQDRTVLDHKLVNFDDMSSSELEMYEESDDQGLDPHERRHRVHVTMVQLRKHLQSGILLRICESLNCVRPESAWLIFSSARSVGSIFIAFVAPFVLLLER
jgi:hypothetical protein